MCQRDLAGLVLQHIRKSSLQNARRSAAEARRMLAQRFAAASSLYADQLYFLVLDEVVEDANRVRPSADAGDDGFRQFAFGFENLDASFASNDAVEVAHHGRIGMRSKHAAQQVMRGADVGDPVPHGFVDGVFQGARSGTYAAHFGS